MFPGSKCLLSSLIAIQTARSELKFKKRFSMATVQHPVQQHKGCHGAQGKDNGREKHGTFLCVYFGHAVTGVPYHYE